MYNMKKIETKYNNKNIFNFKDLRKHHKLNKIEGWNIYF